MSMTLLIHLTFLTVWYYPHRESFKFLDNEESTGAGRQTKSAIAAATQVTCSKLFDWKFHGPKTKHKLYKTGTVCIMQQWRAFLQPLLRWKSNEYYIFWVCVFKCRYPACNAHAQHCHLCPALLYNIFPHYLIYGTIFKKLLNIKHVFSFSLQCLPESFLILRRTGQVMIKNVYWPSCRVPIIHGRF
jgi:hypothetical protein